MELQSQSVTHSIIGAAIESHSHLGPGLLESAYQACLAHELRARGLRFVNECSIPIHYKGTILECGYRVDFLVEDTVIVELKSARGIDPMHRAQLLTYMRLARIGVGLLINFNVTRLKDGIRRMVL